MLRPTRCLSRVGRENSTVSAIASGIDFLMRRLRVIAGSRLQVSGSAIRLGIE